MSRVKSFGFGRNANLVLLSTFLAMFAYGGLLGFVGNLYMLRLGYGLAFVGQVGAACLLAFCAFSFPAGFLVSRWGLRRSLIAGALLYATRVIVFPFAELFPDPLRAAVLLTSCLPGGAGAALFFACVTPCLMDTESSRRAAALSASAMVMLVAQSLGGIAGGALISLSCRLWGLPESSPAVYRLGLAAAVAAQLGSIAAVLPVRLAPAAVAEGAPSLEAGAPLRAPASLLAVAMASSALLNVFPLALQTFFSLDLDQTFRVPAPTIGMIVAAARGVPALAFVLSPVLVRRYGAYRTAVLCGVLAALAAAPVGLASGWLLAAGGYAAMGFLSSLGNPALSLLFQEAVSAPARPVLTGATNAAFGLGAGGALFAGGFAIERVGYGPFFMAALALQAAGIAVFALYFGLRARRIVAGAPGVPTTAR